MDSVYQDQTYSSLLFYFKCRLKKQRNRWVSPTKEIDLTPITPFCLEIRTSLYQKSTISLSRTHRCLHWKTLSFFKKEKSSKCPSRWDSVPSSYAPTAPPLQDGEKQNTSTSATSKPRGSSAGNAWTQDKTPSCFPFRIHRYSPMMFQISCGGSQQTKTIPKENSSKIPLLKCTKKRWWRRYVYFITGRMQPSKSWKETYRCSL